MEQGRLFDGEEYSSREPSIDELQDNSVARLMLLGNLSLQEALSMEQDAFERSLGERPELPPVQSRLADPEE